MVASAVEKLEGSRFRRSQVEDNQNQQPMAFPHGLTEQNAGAKAEKFATVSRSSETEELAAAGNTGIADANNASVCGALAGRRPQAVASNNHQPLAFSLTLPEQYILPAGAEPEQNTTCSRSGKTEALAAAGTAGSADANSLSAQKIAESSNVADCSRSSKTEIHAHGAAAVSAGIASKNRAWADVAGVAEQNTLPKQNRAVYSSNKGAEVAGIAGLHGRNLKPENGLCGSSKTEDPSAVNVEPAIKISGAGAGSANINSATNIEVLTSSHRKGDDAQLLASFPSPEICLPAHHRGMDLPHPAARGVAAHLTACDDVIFVLGEDARGPFGQSGMQVDHAQFAFSFPETSVHSAAANNINSNTCTPTVRQNASTKILQNSAALSCTEFAQTAASTSSNSRNCPPAVRQNAAVSFPQHSAVFSKPNSPLHLQTSEKQQVPQLELHASRAVHSNQQGKVLQQQPSSSKQPIQQAQPSPTASSAWTRKEYISFGDIDLSNSAHLRDGVVQLDKASILHIQSKLASSLVGKLFGRRLPFHFLAAELHKRWGHYDGFKVLDAGKDCFICQFRHDADRDAIFRSGPWTVAGQILGLDVWSLEFDPSSSVGASTPIWVRLPELPLYCWGKENLARISSEIGAPLWLDPITANMDKIAFARVCVRVNLAQPFKSGVWINGPKGKFFQRVEYEGITVICFKCGVVGHRDKNCSLQGPTSQVNASTTPSPARPP
ncbi:hypothetical protein AXF42_Ash020011 [Apostasia shenzhenica]|uniref:CCHC-type domain-containing protein n=1 Tax=Apostasia shenzhenica TaxID=1088818 RepID=A0A2H9ZSJ6_9ASPA|nr:hypothetical protein AXF42_Ash020011 [Apostasia shenzhenica]